MFLINVDTGEKCGAVTSAEESKTSSSLYHVHVLPYDRDCDEQCRLLYYVIKFKNEDDDIEVNKRKCIILSSTIYTTML